MAMRRGVHTSRVLKALATPNGSHKPKLAPRPKLSKAEIIPNQFPGLERRRGISTILDSRHLIIDAVILTLRETKGNDPSICTCSCTRTPRSK